MTCPHGFVSPASCFDCMMEGPVVEQSIWKKVGRSWQAKFEGHCFDSRCRQGIEVGDWIIRWDKGDETAYTHEECQP